MDSQPSAHNVRQFLEDFEVQSSVSCSQSEITENQRRRKRRIKGVRDLLSVSSDRSERNDLSQCGRSKSMVNTQQYTIFV